MLLNVTPLLESKRAGPCNSSSSYLYCTLHLLGLLGWLRA